MIRRIYDNLAWYPWISSVLRDFMTGSLKERLSLQKPRDRALSILLNGPSLSKTLKYLDRDKTDVCMVNFAISTELYEQMKPEFICLADPVFFTTDKKLFEYYKRIKEINPKQVIFYPNYVNIVHLKKWKFKLKRVYTADDLFDVNKYSKKLLEKNLMAPYFINVGIMALYVGIQLGYKEIFLHGADFSFFKTFSVNERLEVEMEDVHFYGTEKVSKECNMRRHMQCVEEAISQFYIMEKYAKAEHAKIINMSDESMLDCFERYKPVE